MTPNDQPNPAPIEMFIHDYMLFLDGARDEPLVKELPAGDRREAQARIRLLEATMAAGAEAPAGAFERIALRFGFDRAGTTIVVSGPKLKGARRRAGLELKQVSAAMAAAATPIRTGDLLHIETAATTPVDQPVVTALVAILGTTVDDIEAEFDDDVNEMRAMLNSPRFEQMIAEWASDHGRDVPEIRTIVYRQVLATKYRAEGVNEDQLADLVRAILRSLER